jgi:hypothetical protein
MNYLNSKNQPSLHELLISTDSKEILPLEIVKLSKILIKRIDSVCKEARRKI